MALSRLSFIWIFVAAFLATPGTRAEEDPTAASKDVSAEESEATTDETEKKKEEEKEFAEVIEDFDVIEGLFTLYRNQEDNKVYLEINPDQLGEIFLCDVARDAGDGYFYDSGSMNGGFPFVFERVGKKIRFVHKNVYYRADVDAPIAAAVERGLTNSLVGSAKFESKPHPDRGSFLVDPTSFFIKDYLGVAASLKERTKKDYSFDADESYFASIRSFPLNTEIETVAHFTSGQRRPTNMRIPDSRSFEHRYRFSLIAIPKTDYVPRLADDRVGYFLTQFQDFTTLTKEQPYTWYIQRWNLKKAEPGKKVSKPVQPITFWLENTIPHEYRDAVRAGALLWNTAFERIGFKDAIVVKQQPDDAEWDPADIRYNVIRWIVMPGGTYAVGPSSANPFTGELYAADIRVSADFVRYFFRSYEEYINPLAAFADITNVSLRPEPSRSCNHSRGKALEAAFGLDVLTTRGFIDPSSKEFQEYVNDGITDLVSHEVGHTLGFRHNFRASTVHDLDQLHDEKLTRQEGVSGSVMDYNPVNIAGRDRKQGSYWCTSLGTYDYWVVEYGYKPIEAETPEDERKALGHIASRASEPKLAYGTDEDAFGYSPQGIDPVTNMWDYTADPIAFYRERLDLAAELLGKIERDFAASGARYQKMRLVFGRGLRQYYAAAATVSKFPGGIYFRRDHVGDPRDRLPFEPVAAEKQREALDFLKEYIFGVESFTFAPSLANKLAPERLYDFDWTMYYQPRVDYPIHAAVLGAQKVALTRLYHPITLNRMLDFPLHVGEGVDVLTMHEMFQELYDTIWSELKPGQSIGSMRRNLQRSHLDRLASLVVRPQGAPYYTPASGREPAGHLPPPEDARSFARANLVQLSEEIESALDDGTLDAPSRAHLDECHARVEAALEAHVQRDL
jgi:hypothetical protein